MARHFIDDFLRYFYKISFFVSQLSLLLRKLKESTPDSFPLEFVCDLREADTSAVFLNQLLNMLHSDQYVKFIDLLQEIIDEMPCQHDL